MPKSVGADQHSTFTKTEYLTLADGHYKTTVYGKDNKGEYKVELKAKSKVIKVECAPKALTNPKDPCTPTTPTTPTNPSTPTTPTTPTTQTNPGSTNGGGQGSATTGVVSGTSTTKANGQGNAAPAVIAATGAHPLQALFNTLLAGAGVYTALLRRK
ncbi:MAG: hypothetical protein WAW60_00885 [Candidatus Saccharimonadales bacterium]